LPKNDLVFFTKIQNDSYISENEVLKQEKRNLGEKKNKPEKTNWPVKKFVRPEYALKAAVCNFYVNLDI